MKISIERVMVKEIKRGTSKSGFPYGFMELVDTDTNGELSLSFQPEVDFGKLETQLWMPFSCVLTVKPRKQGYNQSFDLLAFHFGACKAPEAQKEG